jgi:hypothetical protein
MKKLTVLLAVLVLCLAATGPVLAQENHECDHQGTSVASLHHCVEHAIEHGYISKAGVGRSLLAKLDAADAAVARGQSATSANILNAFVQQVSAQAGKGIDAEHARHLISHAQAVIANLTLP